MRVRKVGKEAVRTERRLRLHRALRGRKEDEDRKEAYDWK
jgi:hypothetical protein